MENRFTKFLLKHLRSIFAGIFVSLTAIMAFSADSLIAYYCSANSPKYFGIEISGSQFCSFAVSASFIVLSTVILTAALFGITFLADVIAWSLQRIKRRLKSTRRAKIIVGNVVLKNEIYVFVHNLEFWLRSEKVYAETRFIYVDHVTNSRIKWFESSSKNGEISIPRRKTKTLHFATINVDDDSFTMHKIDGDETFPKGEFSYKFPLYIHGEMFFWNKTPRVSFDEYLTLAVDYKGKDKVSVKTDKS